MNLIPKHSVFDFDSLFDAFWPTAARAEEQSDWTSLAPRVDIREKRDIYEISAELPGVNKDDVQVHLNNGILSIEAEHHQEDKEEKDGKILRQERRYGKFVRSFNLGRDLDESQIKAEFNNGVLKLEVPRVEAPEAQVKKIPIQ